MNLVLFKGILKATLYSWYKSLMKYIYIFIQYFVFAISLVFPRDKKIWIFIGWRSSKEREIFAENPKYLFLYTSQNLPEIKAIWIGMDKSICKTLTERGYKAHSVNSVLGIWYSLIAGYTFIGANLQMRNWRYSGKTRIIQLWHGKSVKKTGFNTPYFKSRHESFLAPQFSAKFFKFISISHFLSKYIISDFNMRENEILVTGIPKHDVLKRNIKDSDIDCDEELNSTLEEIRSRDHNRIFLYGPTFRPDGANPLSEINLIELEKRLQKNNDYLVITLHPKFSVKKWIPEYNFRHIFFSQGDRDKYPLLHKFDALITDYSSLSLDFLLMEKPVISFVFDIEIYRKKMGIYEELWNLMPNPKIYSFEELLKIFDRNLDEYQGEIKHANKAFFSFRDGDASKRIAELILKH